MKARRPSSRSRSKTKGTLAVGSSAVLGIMRRLRIVSAKHLIRSRLVLRETSNTVKRGKEDIRIYAVPLASLPAIFQQTGSCPVVVALTSIAAPGQNGARSQRRPELSQSSRRRRTRKANVVPQSTSLLRRSYHGGMVMPNDPKLSHADGRVAPQAR